MSMQVEVNTRRDGIVVLAWQGGMMTLPAENGLLQAVPASWDGLGAAKCPAMAGMGTGHPSLVPGTVYRGGGGGTGGGLEAEASLRSEPVENEEVSDEDGIREADDRSQSTAEGVRPAEEAPEEGDTEWCIIDRNNRVLLSGLTADRAASIVEQVVDALVRPGRRLGVIHRFRRLMVMGLAGVGAGTIGFLGYTAYQALQPLAVVELAPAGVNGVVAEVQKAAPAAPPKLPIVRQPEGPRIVTGPAGLGEAWLKASGTQSGAGAAPFGVGGPVIGGGNVEVQDLQDFGLKP